MQEIILKDMTPRLSVVIPCYNSINTVGECISSIQDQTYSKNCYEIIAVDNGSTDGTCEYLKAKFPMVQLIHSTEKGSGYARNAGIKEARGEFILSTDADCVVDKNWMLHLVSAFETASPDVAAVGGQIKPYSSKTAVERYQPAWVSQPDINRVQPGVRYAATPNAAFRASALKQVGYFDGSVGHDDTDLGIRLILLGYRIEFTDAATVQHRNPATLRELYGHRAKYGMRNFSLGRKHPQILGDPLIPGTRSKLFLATARRVLGDLIVKQPMAIFAVSGDRPKIWPLIDATMALGNFSGFYRAACLARISSRTL